ncbi:ABC transporter permease [bacterium]|nr:ABC transporter permease [bacterium]
MTALTTQLQAEMNVVRRNGEQLLVTLGIPLLLLGFFSAVDVLPTNEKDPVNFLVPGILALAVMSTSMVSLGIATGFERNYLVLKRLAATPLGTTRLIAAKTLSIAAVEAVQMILLISLGFLLGWSPQQANWLLALCAVVLGTFAFAGIGLFLAGNLRGEVNLAATNGLYLVLLLIGGIVFPLDKLPGALSAISRCLPTAALSDVLRNSLMSAGEHTTSSWIVLLVWAIAAPLLAAKTFKWN